MILHVDMDAFYASVELRDHPDLVGKPVVVGGSPKGRGVIAAASYEARKFGLHSAMPAAKAIKLCPQAVFIKPRMAHYSAISNQLREIFSRFTSLVEPLAFDEAFLDVSGCEKLFGDATSIGQQIQQTIQSELRLTASVGVAPNKFLAKVASDLKKPAGFVVVATDTVEAFLDQLPIARVWGIGPKTETKFQKLGVQRIGQLRALPKATLKQLFGLNADHFWRLARGIDSRPVVPDRIAKNVGHETTFPRDIHDDETLLAWIVELSDQVGRRLRRNHIYGKTIQLKVRFYDFRTITRSKTIAASTHTTQDIATTAGELLQQARESCGDAIRLLGVSVGNLSRESKQQQLLFGGDENAKAKRMDSAADAIRDRFGSSAMTRGSSLKVKRKRRDDLGRN
jgi:DNA polymerase-4